MAPRGRTAGFREAKFYVYAFYEGGVAAYVGKGTGRRFATQAKRFGLKGRILKTFVSEKAAYNYEARLISKLKPRLNVAAGGGGAISRKKAALPAWFRRDLQEISTLGSRVYAARELMKLDLSAVIPASKVEAIRSVAYG